jgi:hypothetical protein
VTNIPKEIEGVLINIHPSKPEMGQRVLRRYHEIYLEVDDAQLFAEGEEVTLVRWGNFFIDRIVKDENGTVLSLEVPYLPPSSSLSPFQLLIMTWTIHSLFGSELTSIVNGWLST